LSDEYTKTPSLLRPKIFRIDMPIIVTLDIMLAKLKMKSKDLAQKVGITEQNLSLLKSGKVKGCTI
jgi:hypothetical protein